MRQKCSPGKMVRKNAPEKCSGQSILPEHFPEKCSGKMLIYPENAPEKCSGKMLREMLRGMLWTDQCTKRARLLTMSQCLSSSIQIFETHLRNLLSDLVLVFQN